MPTAAMTPKERFLFACQGREVDRPPVWMMRQAGRYLPEYRAIKMHHTTKQMMQTPAIAAKITTQPVTSLSVDAAILYSDILMIPDTLGMGLEFTPGSGPKFAFKIDSDTALNRLNVSNVNTRLSCVFEAVRLCVKDLGRDFPLLGFAGAPFTVACYMICGGSAGGDFAATKSLAWNAPKTFHALMDTLTSTTIAYLLEQADAGAVAVQLFDTWAGLLAPQDYATLAKPYSQKIFAALRSAGIPSIHYIKGGDFLIPELREMSSDVLGVDWRVELSTIRERLGNTMAVQGNLDPDVLFAHPDFIRERVQKMLVSIPHPNRGYIVNLGHGIHHQTPVENARAFIAAVKGLAKG